MKLSFIFAALLLVTFVQAQPSQTAPTQAEREARWHEDFKVLSSGLKAPGIKITGGIATRGQKDFADVYPHFDADLAAISEAIPTLTDAEILLRLMRLIASANIAHNSIETPPGMGFLNRLPVEFHWFADGLGISAATPEYTSLLGMHVRGIGGKTPEQFLLDLTPWISHENDPWLRSQSVGLMTARGFLVHFGMLSEAGTVALSLESTIGETKTVSLPLLPANTSKVGIAEGLHIPAALYRSHPNTWYWSQYLPDSQSLFVQYNVCANDSKHHFSDIARQVLADSDSHPVKNVVIDLRWNGGGDSSVINPLKSGLASRLKSLGRVYVLIGPATFSSAVDNAASLRKELSATLVGEPSGGMTDGYGEVSRLTLPNSKLVVRFTTKRWGPKISTQPTTLIPDIPAPFKLADFIAGRDPVLDAAISPRP